MNLLLVFNQNFVAVLRILKTSFDDIPELILEFQRVTELVEQDASCKEMHDEFEQDIDQKMIDQIFLYDDAVIMDETINFMKRSNLKSAYERMFPAEKDVLWKNLQALCRFSSMLRACGDQLTDMEDMAVDFMKDHGSVSPEDYQMKLFQEMLSGGDMSKKLLATFQDPKCIRNILANVGNIMKTDSKGTGSDDAGLSDFASLLNMPFSEADLQEVSKNISQGIPGLSDLEEKVVEVNDSE